MRTREGVGSEPSLTRAAADATHRLQATIAQLEPATHDIVRLCLEPCAPLSFAAGQYAELWFEGCPARPYSMANRPGDELLEFHVRHVPGGLVSGHVARAARLGDCVEVEGPFGSACLREPLEGPLLLVAGGSGLAPLKSILLAALARPAPAPIHLYHGVRDLRDLYDGHVLAAAAGGLRLVPVLSDPSGPRHHRRGFVHEAVAQDFRSLAGYRVHVAGPPPMVDAVVAKVLRLGAARGDVHADPFFAARKEEHGQREGILQRLFGA